MYKSIQLSTFFLLLSLNVQAQDCGSESFGIFENGAIIEMTAYDAQENVKYVTEIEIMDVEPLEGKLRSEIIAIIENADGEIVQESEYDLFCEGGRVKGEGINFVNPEFLQDYYGMNFTADSDVLEIPADLETGQELPEVFTGLSMGDKDASLFSISFTMTDRKVQGKRTVSTPLGEKEGFVITHDFKVKTVFTKSFKVEEVFVKGIGIVESRVFTKKGELRGYSKLTKLDL